MAYGTRKPEIRPPCWIIDYWTLVVTCLYRAYVYIGLPPESMGIASVILQLYRP